MAEAGLSALAQNCTDQSPALVNTPGNSLICCPLSTLAQNFRHPLNAQMSLLRSREESASLAFVNPELCERSSFFVFVFFFSRSVRVIILLYHYYHYLFLLFPSFFFFRAFVILFHDGVAFVQVSFVRLFYRRDIVIRNSCEMESVAAHQYQRRLQINLTDDVTFCPLQ